MHHANQEGQTMSTETGHLSIAVPLDYNPEDSRTELAEAARRQGGELVGTPEILPADAWPPECGALEDNLKIIRWTMTRDLDGETNP
jgi:hypothetical protein